MRKHKKSENPKKRHQIYRVEKSDVLGRYLVASKDLKPGEIVLKEKPIVVGPCQESKPLCLGCYVKLSLESENNYHRCENCDWPLCSKNCPGTKAKFGHSTEECHILSKRRERELDVSSLSSCYYAIMPLRCLLMKSSDPDTWKIFKSMESHDEIRKKNRDLWKTNEKLAVEKIRDFWGFRQFSAQEIHNICGILEVNAFEIASSCDSESLRAIYPTAFLFSHDCVPNTSHSDDKNFELTVRAIDNIPANSIITVNYTYVLQSTLKRRKHLFDTKFFCCCCKRCESPTELDTYLGAIKCSFCTNGYFLPTNPLDDDSDWQCDSPKCKRQVNVSQIIFIANKLGQDLDAIDGNDIDGYEQFLVKTCNILHDNHYLRLSAFHSLSLLYGKVTGYLINELTDEQLQRKIQICRKLISIFKKLEPGLSKNKGILLYELQAPLMVLLTRDYQRGILTNKELKAKVKEVGRYLQESLSILSKEPRDSQEGKMAQAAQEALQNLVF